MVRKKSKTKKPLTLFGKKFSRSTLIIAVVAFMVVGFALYTAIANELDRRKFAQIEETVLELTDRINAEFGTETLNIDKSCSRPREKYGKGALGCLVKTQSSQKYIDHSILSQFVEAQQDLVSNITSSDENFRTVRFLPFVDSVSCSVENDLIYTASPSKRLELKNEYVTTVSCGSLARISHYPVVE